ncbi:MAG: molybdenum cofactor guanylyltransferase [Planctomycetota bacterium]
MSASSRGASVTRIGGIVLCGGQARRMGRDKASLELGGRSFLTRVIDVVASVVSPVVVVAAPGQILSLPSRENVSLAYDQCPGQGPLHGMARGFQELPQAIEAAFVSSCDLPLLRPEWISFLISRLDEFEVVLPIAGGYEHPLAGLYRREVETTAWRLLDEGRRRTVSLAEEHRTLRIPEQELRSVDPELDSLRNVNTPGDFAMLESRWHALQKETSNDGSTIDFQTAG